MREPQPLTPCSIRHRLLHERLLYDFHLPRHRSPKTYHPEHQAEANERTHSDRDPRAKRRPKGRTRKNFNVVRRGKHHKRARYAGEDRTRTVPRLGDIDIDALRPGNGANGKPLRKRSVGLHAEVDADALFSVRKNRLDSVESSVDVHDLACDGNKHSETIRLRGARGRMCIKLRNRNVFEFGNARFVMPHYLRFAMVDPVVYRMRQDLAGDFY